MSNESPGLNVVFTNSLLLIELCRFLLFKVGFVASEVLLQIRKTGFLLLCRSYQGVELSQRDNCCFLTRDALRILVDGHGSSDMILLHRIINTLLDDSLERRRFDSNIMRY